MVNFWFLARVPRAFNGKPTVSSTNNTGKTGYPQAKEWSWTFITPYTKTNSKWLKDPNVRVKTVKLLGGEIGVNLCDLGLGKHKMTSKMQVTKGKKINWTSLKSKPFVYQRIRSKNWKDDLHSGKKSCSNYVSDKTVVATIYKEL